MTLRVGTNYVRQLLNAAEEAGFKMIVRCDGEVDYSGYHPASAEDAIMAVDEAMVTFREGNGNRAGWVLIVNGLAEDERIADTAGEWVEQWWQHNIGATLCEPCRA